MIWIPLTSELQLEVIKADSSLKPQVIFKHSTRCSISSLAKNRLERSVPPPQTDFYYLDLFKYRSLSDKLAEIFDVVHESPQVLLIKDATCIYDESHSSVSMKAIEEQVNRYFV